MLKSYSKNYIKIYFFQILSILLGFISLFIVIPLLSENQSIYGIYSVCISITIFLSYADLGFLGAGMKYAAESFSQGDRENEIKMVGFSHFILFIFVSILSLIFLFLSFHPETLIKGLENQNQRQIAQNLLLILALFSPTIIIQRSLQMIFGIRLQEYILQKINIIGNIIKIISVLFFFRKDNYDIVGYFLFIQIVNLIFAFIGILQAKKKFNYDFKFLLRNFKFNNNIFKKIRALAFSSLFVTLSWIVYYELDSFTIAKVLDAKQVAIYAIGFTILTFFRSILGVFFSPFSARFNHFIGDNKENELKKFYEHILKITLPIVIFPIIAVVMYARPIVISWVGVDYEKSIDIVQWLVLCNILAFITYPSGMLMVALERIKEIYILNFIIPIIYWTGVYLTINTLGVKSFAVFKFVAFLISGLMYLRISLSFLKISFFEFIKKNIIPFIPAVIIMVLFLNLLKDSYIDDKNKKNLLLNIAFIGSGISIGFLICILSVKTIKEYFFKIINNFKKNDIT